MCQRTSHSTDAALRVEGLRDRRDDGDLACRRPSTLADDIIDDLGQSEFLGDGPERGRRSVLQDALDQRQALRVMAILADLCPELFEDIVFLARSALLVSTADLRERDAIEPTDLDDVPFADPAILVTVTCAYAGVAVTGGEVGCQVQVSTT